MNIEQKLEKLARDHAIDWIGDEDDPVRIDRVPGAAKDLMFSMGFRLMDRKLTDSEKSLMSLLFIVQWNSSDRLLKPSDLI